MILVNPNHMLGTMQYYLGEKLLFCDVVDGNNPSVQVHGRKYPSYIYSSDVIPDWVVLFGWETDQGDWDRALEGALQDPSIIQERALIAYEEFPSIDENGGVEVSRRRVDCDPFLFHGDTVGGCLVRLSTVTLLNVTAGGGSVVPMFVIAEK